MLLVSNSVVPQNMRRFKWHVLPVVKAMICGKEGEPMTSKKVEKSAAALIEIMGQHSKSATDVFGAAVDIFQSLGEVTNDRLKRQAILGEMLVKVA